MKKLIFIRHGRAEEQASGISDFERSLTVKGKVISGEMARRFREKESDPGLLVTSPAFRALETAYIFAAEYGINPEEIRIDSNLYFKPGMKHLMGLLGSVGDGVNTITLFGHNPSFTEMPDRLCKNGCEFLTKTSIVCISFQIKTWSELKLDTGTQEYFLKPVK
ncbi:MAG: histidine phosphatase family protein [Bacteroidales bacterium]|nr:histidine phosphatase family protein [Bacteroidales bacterium]